MRGTNWSLLSKTSNLAIEFNNKTEIKLKKKKYVKTEWNVRWQLIWGNILALGYWKLRVINYDNYFF